MPKKAQNPPPFEEALAELERLVEALEQGELPLEESLKTFERGVELTRSCQQALNAAKQRVEILSGKSVDATLEPFDREQ